MSGYLYVQNITRPLSQKTQPYQDLYPMKYQAHREKRQNLQKVDNNVVISRFIAFQSKG